MKTQCIFHITGRTRAEAAIKAGEYRTPGIESDGFIHCSQAHQVPETAMRFYAGLRDQVVMVIDPSLLRAELRFEAAGHPAADTGGSGPEDGSLFPHLYGPLNADAVIDLVDLELFDGTPVHPDTRAMLLRYRFSRLPVEGTLYKSTWRSSETVSGIGGTRPVGTAMAGLYTDGPRSVSCFHRLDTDEVWHFYNGDPAALHLLHPDGRTQTVIMGSDAAGGQAAQFTIPAGVWQAGEMLAGGRYSLFGCTMAPGFTPGCFEAASPEKLTAKFPGQAAVIKRLSSRHGETRLPADFSS